MSLKNTNIPITRIQNIEVTSFEINVDKLKYRLTQLFPRINAKSDGWSILGVLVAAFIPFITCNFKDFLHIPSVVWMLIFGGLVIWVGVELYKNWDKGRKSLTIEEFVDELMDESIVTMSNGKKKKYKRKISR